MIELDKAEYRMNDVAQMLGVSMNRLWRLRMRLGFPTRVRGIDRRERWVSAAIVRELHAYLYGEGT